MEENELVCCCSTDGKLYVLEACSGALVGDFKLGGEIFSSPSISRKDYCCIVIGCRDDFVYGLSLEWTEEKTQACC